MNWTKKSSINCYNIEEGRVIERPKGRYISPIRIKNKQQALAQGIIGSGGASTPVCRRILQRDKGSVDGGGSTTVDGSLAKHLSKSIGNISASIGDKSPSLSHRSVVYRDKEKKNPLGSTRLSCYQTINFESSENVTKSQLYKSVDDLIFLNGSTTTDDCERDLSGGDSAVNKERAIHCVSTTTVTPNQLNQSLITSSVSSNSTSSRAASTTEPEHLSTVVAGLAADEPKNDRPKMAGNFGDHDETYGFAQMKETSFETMYRLKLNALKKEEQKTPQKKKDNFTNKIKAMSDRTQKLFSKIYSNSSYKTNSTAEGNFHSAHTKSLKKSPSKISSNRRSVSYGALPGLADFQKNMEKSEQDPKLIDQQQQHQHQQDDDLSGTVIHLAPPSNRHDAEDCDSGILVNESGASSILETEDVFLPSIPSKVLNSCTDNTEFKLVTIKLDECSEEAENLGIIVSPMSNGDSEVSNRYKVAHVLPGGLVYT